MRGGALHVWTLSSRPRSRVPFAPHQVRYSSVALAVNVGTMLFAGPAPAVEAALASLGPQMRWSAALFVSLAGVCAAIGMRFAEDTGGNEDEQRLIGVASRSDAPVGVALPVLQMVSRTRGEKVSNGRSVSVAVPARKIQESITHQTPSRPVCRS